MASVLGLDLATQTGWAYFDDHNRLGGVWDLSPGKDQSRPVRLHRLWRYLNDLNISLDVVAYEQPGSLHGAARKILPALQGVAELWAFQKGFDIETYTPSQVKKFATGNGRASKEEMMEAAEKEWPGVVIVRHDQADAMWVAELALNRRESGVRSSEDQRVSKAR